MVLRSLEGVSDEEIRKITHRNAMQIFQYDPFAHIPEEEATVGALPSARRRLGRQHPFDCAPPPGHRMSERREAGIRRAASGAQRLGAAGARSGSMSGVLDGVRVVEVSMWAFVPGAGAILAEWGADVVKVEGPTGDPVRGLVTAGLKPNGPAFTWEMWNRGKRGIVLDLRLPEGRDVLHQLVAEADVFLTSILPAQRASLGVDLDAIRTPTRRSSTRSGTGQGARGPRPTRAGTTRSPSGRAAVRRPRPLRRR